MHNLNVELNGQEIGWYIIYTRSRHEQVVHDQLTNQGLEVFLPKLAIWSRRTDRRKMIKVPMFPGYLFVHTDLNCETRLTTVKAKGVVRIVAFNNIPPQVPPEEIDSLKILIKSDFLLHSMHNFASGDKVRITSGPLKGVVGRFVRKHNANRVIVSIEAINRSVFVEIDDNFIIQTDSE